MTISSPCLFFLLSVLSSLVIERTNTDHKIQPNNVVDIVSKERDDREQKECSDDVGTKLCANRWIAHYDSCSLDDLFPFLLSPHDTLRHRQLSSKEASPNNNPPPLPLLSLLSTITYSKRNRILKVHPFALSSFPADLCFCCWTKTREEDDDQPAALLTNDKLQKFPCFHRGKKKMK